MTKNIGMADRVLRFSFGVILLSFAWWQHSWIAFAFALFCFYEALMSWCVLYQLLGKNSCPIDRQK